MVYLDNAANAPVFPEVLEAMLPWLRPDHVGNPGSLHTQGVKAREAVENARRQVAKMIGADPSEVFFTSGGTESNNAWLQNFGGDLILTTALEHDSVLEPMSAHCHRHYIKVHKDGSVSLWQSQPSVPNRSRRTNVQSVAALCIVKQTAGKSFQLVNGVAQKLHLPAMCRMGMDVLIKSMETTTMSQ